MSRMPRLAYVWPGLPQLWHAGFWWGLVLAAGFAVLVDLLLVASFVWVELFGPLDLRLGWLAAGSLWGASAILSIGFHPRERDTASADLLFREALNEYLQGNWFEAETVLARLMKSAPRDVEARLLLATLLRRTGRHDLALEQLDRLERLRDAVKWTREIARERQDTALARSSVELAEPQRTSDDAEPTVSRQAA